MGKKLVLSVCNFMIPELNHLINEGDYPDVKLQSFASNCTANPDKFRDINTVLSQLNPADTDIYFIGSHCNSPKNDKPKLPGHIREIYLEQCFELFLNKEIVSHFISNGYYLVTNGWLQHYKQNIKSWGFEEDVAKAFFRESMKKILFLDTKIPGDYMSGLKAISNYMGLPYETLPVGLSHCKGFVDSLVGTWRAENERKMLDGRIAAISKQSADYSVIFHQLGTLVNLRDEQGIIRVGFDLINILFAPAQITFVRHHDGQTQEYKYESSFHKQKITIDNSVDFEVNHADQSLGIFKVQGVEFVQYMGEYKKMGVVISQLFGLSIANARKYEVILGQTEQLKVNTQELRKINQSKDKFFSIIAHDLKGPFHNLIGASELLLEEIQDGTPENVTKLSDIIHNTSIQTFNLLVNLLEWSRSQTGLMEFLPQTFQLLDTVTEIFEILKYQADKKNILLDKSITNDFQVCGDLNMITTVIRNLVSNAIKFTHQGGSIKVSATMEEGITKVSVRDNGVGIKPENIEKIFSIENSTSTDGTDKEKGTGLGLILCREFIEKHKGQIGVKSEVGKGSVFYFTLPLKF